MNEGDVNLGGGHHCSFEVLKVEREFVTIKDLDLGGKSVTNDAAHVIEQLRGAELLFPGRKLYYFDSMGNLDEVIWDESGVKGFRPGPGRQKIPVNPHLPRDFENTANADRPQSHMRWWKRPFIQTITWEQMKPRDPLLFEEYRAKWLESWPTGTRYDVRCLDGGAWDRSTCWGSFGTLEQAQECARQRIEAEFL